MALAAHGPAKGYIVAFGLGRKAFLSYLWYESQGFRRMISVFSAPQGTG